MRATGTTMISRDSIVYPTMEGGSKGEIKEGPASPLSRRAPLHVQSGYLGRTT
jgi:hypothetical protein